MTGRLLQSRQAIDLWPHLSRVILDSDLAGHGIEVIKSADRRKTMRLTIGDESSLVIKVWYRRKWPHFVYQSAYRWTTAYREWRIPQLLERCGIPAGRSLGYFSFIESSGRIGEAVVLEDLGECGSAFGLIKQATAENDAAEIDRYESELVNLTAAFIDNGFIDTDHQLNNCTSTPSGKLMRLDFEHCHRIGPRLCRLATSRYGIMLAKVISSYTFAVQPRVELAARFAESLAGRILPPRRVLRCTSAEIHRMMEKQRVNSGIDTRVSLPW